MREISRLEMRAIGGGSDGDDSIVWCYDPGRTSRSKGNNGWGNGAEGINAGSFSGATAGSKSDESWTAGDGPKPRKFDSR